MFLPSSSFEIIEIMVFITINFAEFIIFSQIIFYFFRNLEGIKFLLNHITMLSFLVCNLKPDNFITLEAHNKHESNMVSNRPIP